MALLTNGNNIGSNTYILPIHRSNMYYVLLLCAHYANGEIVVGIFGIIGWSDKLIHQAHIGQFERWGCAINE